MKIDRSLKNKRYKLLKFKLIKTKIYKTKNKLNLVKIEEIKNRIKKAFHLIYKYHINNKRILFIGMPSLLDSKIKYLFENTKHIIIPESIWVNGMISNKSLYTKYKHVGQKNDRISDLVLKLKKESDLIVILNEFTNLEALNEGYKNRIPIISLNSEFTIFNNKSTYKIPGNFKYTQKQILNDFFYSIMTATFKKALQRNNITKPMS